MSIFEEEILDEPGVCHNCFRKTHDLEEIHYPRRVENRPITGTTLRKERFFTREDQVEKVYPPWEIPVTSPVGRNICKCGVISSRTKRRPLDLSKMIEYGQYLSDRLDEMNIPHDEDIFFQHLKEEKKKPDRQHEDDKIFEEAVEKATSHAQAQQW